MPLQFEELPCGCSISIRSVEREEDMIERDGWEVWESECPSCGKIHLYMVHIEGNRIN